MKFNFLKSVVYLLLLFFSVSGMRAYCAEVDNQNVESLLIELRNEYQKYKDIHDKIETQKNSRNAVEFYSVINAINGKYLQIIAL